MVIMLVNKIISSLMQIGLFSLIPFLWWAVTAHKKESFFSWIGLKKIKINKRDRKGLVINVVVIALGYTLMSIVISYLTIDIETATSEFAGMGINALLPALVWSIFNTALPEEILFRGFLLKRLANKFGYLVANIIQSILFGLIHGLMFISVLGIIKAIAITLATGLMAYAMGYINEKKADGSILPSWLIHACSNLYASIEAMFFIV